MRSFFRLLKNNSATALSPQLPFRLVLDWKLWWRQKLCQSSLLYWEPGRNGPSPWPCTYPATAPSAERRARSLGPASASSNSRSPCESRDPPPHPDTAIPATSGYRKYQSPTRCLAAPPRSPPDLPDNYHPSACPVREHLIHLTAGRSDRHTPKCQRFIIRIRIAPEIEFDIPAVLRYPTLYE